MSGDQPAEPGYPIRSNEDERLREVLKYRFADGGANIALNRICQLAQDFFDVPVSLVTLVAESDQTFLARCGVGIRHTERRDAFCNWTIARDEVFVVPDASADARFAENPFVAGEMGIRFYAGAPLKIRPGVALGSLCLIDTKPRQFSAEDRKRLATLASIATNELRRLRTIIDLKWRTRLLSQATMLNKLGSWSYDPSTGKVQWSQEMFRIHGLEPTVTPSVKLALSFWQAADRERLRSDFEELIRQGKRFDREIAITTAAGEERWIRCLGEAEWAGEKLLRILGCVQDITEEREYQANLERIAFRDRLTGLPNRAQFLDRLAAITGGPESQHKKVGVAILSLDHFRGINETLGHDAADKLLQATGQRLTEALRPRDILARLGADEFGLILPGIGGHEELRSIVEGHIERLHRLIALDGRNFAVTASAGAAVFPSDHDRPEELMRAANLALKSAKRAGRDQVATFEPWMKIEVERRARLLEDARAGISAGQFHLYYQPIVSLTQPHEVNKFEALMRWEHPSRGTLGPAAFFAALEDPATSLALSEVALEQARQWQEAKVDFGAIAVNLAPAQFRTGNLKESILSRLSRAGVPPCRLIVEVTENISLGSHSEEVADTLRELHRAGVRIALDDFGTGFASLSHLRDFPIDRLKIDKSFVQNIDDSAIVRAVVTLGSGLGMKVVAEGVENTEQIARLCEMGCSEAQGYYFARPMPASEVPGFLAAFKGEGLKAHSSAGSFPRFGLADREDAPPALVVRAGARRSPA